MSKKTVYIDGLGDVIITKRRGSTYLRLRITSKGQVALNMPYWTPYKAGELFIRDKLPWIRQQLSKHRSVVLKDGDLIGKNHRLYFKPSRSATIKTRLGSTTVEVMSCEVPHSPSVQAKAIEVCERALKLQSDKLISLRLQALSQKHNLSYRQLRIRKLSSRWGSCSSKNDITISYYLIQLPWELIDYVLLHELAHTKHMNHSTKFWQFMESLSPATGQLRKQIKHYSPRVMPA